MIAGTGVDIVEVERIAKVIGKQNGFLEKVFSPDEIVFCETKTNPAEHYAARFAAKEAFLKATGKGLLAGLELHHIEIIQDDFGKPHIRLSGAFQELFVENEWQKIHISLSHVQAMACAFVVIEK